MKRIVFDKEFKGKIFLTSDLHYGHENIIRYCDRPFETIQEMNDKLIENWNKTVCEGDLVFILGDFCFGSHSQWNRLLDELKGKKYLIQGNHDHSAQIPHDKFEKVCDLLTISIYDKEEDSFSEILLSHYPFSTWSGINKGVLHCCGHIHSTPDHSELGFDKYVAINSSWNAYDVGVDNNKFTPISYEELKVIFKKRFLRKSQEC
jgi:Predicted phosphoesterase or phosphohydrolase